LPTSAVDVLGKERLLEDYTTIYRQWEDLLSRLIYTKSGIPDDRVAATIHKYLEVNKDKKVLEAIQNAAGGVNTLIEPPKALELPLFNAGNSGIDEGNDILNTPQTAAALLENVINALHAAFPSLLEGDNSADITEPIFSESGLGSRLDTQVWEYLGICIPIRIYSPGDLGTTRMAPLCLSKKAVELLRNSLQVDIEVTGGEKIMHQFNLQQYYALLEMFGNSTEVSTVFKNHSRIALKIPDLEQLQNGSLGLSMTVNPTVAYILQLRAVIAAYTGSEEEKVVEVRRAERALERITGALKSQKDASDAALIGDVDSAIELITEAMEREYSALEEGEEEEGADEGHKAEEELMIEETERKSLLPVYVQVQMLVDRASYYASDGPEHLSDALNDCTTALSLDNLCVAAYALRSQLWVNDEEEEEEEAGEQLLP
jgi:hypothetical protein